MAEKKLQPIIIKRVKKGGHAAHGGAWKIAYADFVTAMMAFFLLMWLLGSTAKGDLQGIAAYFASPLKVAMAGGDGAGNSSSVIPGGGTDLSRVHGQVRRSDSAEDTSRRMDTNSRAERARQDAARIKALQSKIDAMITGNPKLNEYRSQIRIDVTPDGLQIQIVDEQNRPMFDSGSALVKPYMREILQAIGSSLGDVENRISLAGHTDATPYGNADRGYSNWELSADRANASRRELLAGGLREDRVVRVLGMGSSVPFAADDTLNPMNRRISILVLGRVGQERYARGAEVPVSETQALEQLLSRDAPDAVQAARAAAASTPPTPATPTTAPEAPHARTH